MIDRRFLLLAGAGAVAALGYAAFSPFGTSHASDAVFTGETDGVAINGYDPVGYFKQNAAVQGSADHTAQYNGTIWHFASAENRDLFKADPEKYAPQYGGYCAFAAAKNSIAKTEPEAFSIVNGKLYLNYDLSIRSKWDDNKTSFITQADEYWPTLQPK